MTSKTLKYPQPHERSNYPSIHAWVVQANGSADEWLDTKYGCETSLGATEEAYKLLNHDRSWCGNKRWVRIVQAIAIKR